MLHDTGAPSELLNTRNRARTYLVVPDGLVTERAFDDAETFPLVPFAVVVGVEVGASVAHLPLVMQAAEVAEVGWLFASLHSAHQEVSCHRCPPQQGL